MSKVIKVMKKELWVVTVVHLSVVQVVLFVLGDVVVVPPVGVAVVVFCCFLALFSVVCMSLLLLLLLVY